MTKVAKQNLKDKLAYDETFSCVQCGYCLPACPTYQTMGKESHSPRGRINLVKLAAEGKIPLSRLEEPIDLCLGCRACEPACPTNVQYGKILESAKVVLFEEKKEERKGVSARAEDFLFNHIFPYPSRLNKIGSSMFFYQLTGMKKALHATKLINVLPERLSKFDKITPKPAGPFQRRREHHLLPKNQPVLKVGFFPGCIMDTVFRDINNMSMKLLQAAGCEVEIVDQQTCCGALHSHRGDRQTAKELAKQNIEAFEREDFAYIVNSIGGCGAMLSEYHHLFEDDMEWYERAKAFASKTKDISYVLSQLELPFKKDVQLTVTYQPSCHMTNVQKLTDEPLALLKSIPGITFIPMEKPNKCCGSAGIYNLVHYDESMDILDEKMKDVNQVSVDGIVTTNPGCHLQMKLGVEREGKSDQIKVYHLVELLGEACGL
ncbi:(Fe-S)-binding protein [Salinibacillus xinjiangensis]|uniref:Glycolate oxidase iron-sulfur subunit n=1 Tax=Salinibacillus xinjiangensis TaxID=1229268 RepID=A0A6G1X1P6_9BACI|nr:(Fe-S)-binding protein [Salinibacillus xinjiangensis]MRG84917.1 4Fe-4S dicluster domain-containing protein [Salinibacillus xinjiangensis]